MIDAIDLQILELLQANARTSNAEIARQVGLAPSAIFERVKKLEEKGIIRGYAVDLAPKDLGLGLTAFMFVKSEERVGDRRTGERLAAIAEVQEVHHVAGEDCFLLKVRVADTDALGRLLREKIAAIPEVRSTRTTIVFETLKETRALPLGPEAAP